MRKFWMWLADLIASLQPKHDDTPAGSTSDSPAAPASPPVPSPAPKTDELPYAELPWIKVAKKYIGLHEISGPKADPTIAGWLSAVGAGKSDETAWCAASMCGFLREAGYKHSGKANARSFLKVGKKLDKFKPGCIVVFWRVAIDSWEGHVGFAEKLSPDGSQVRVLGGNQGNKVSDAWFGTNHVLGYFWPEKA